VVMSPGLDRPPFPCLGSPARLPCCACGRHGPRAERGKGAPRAPRRRPHTTHAAPYTEPAAAAPSPEPPLAAPLQAGAAEHPYAPWPQPVPRLVRGLPAHPERTAMSRPRPPVVYSCRWGRRTVRRAPPREPSAPVRPNPDGACGAARYASPRSPPAVSRWESRPGPVFAAPARGTLRHVSQRPRERGQFFLCGRG
jgi:hypothetical protein